MWEIWSKYLVNNAIIAPPHILHIISQILDHLCSTPGALDRQKQSKKFTQSAKHVWLSVCWLIHKHKIWVSSHMTFYQSDFLIGMTYWCSRKGSWTVELPIQTENTNCQQVGLWYVIFSLCTGLKLLDNWWRHWNHRAVETHTQTRHTHTCTQTIHTHTHTHTHVHTHTRTDDAISDIQPPILSKLLD